MEINLVPFQPVDFIESFVCRIETMRDSQGPATFCIGYDIKGDLQQVKWPDERDSPRGCRELWRDTCFEYFIGSAHDSSYCEVNQSPNGNWASYEFTDYRSHMNQSQEFGPSEFHISRSPNECCVHLEIPAPGADTFCLGISTVIRDIADQLHYFARSHPDDAPDFHARAHHQLITLETL